MTDSNTNANSSNNLPSYKAPPLNEVVCGMRFNTPDKLRLTHIGLLWEKYFPNYKEVQHATPIASNPSELFIDPQAKVPLPRVWLIREPDDQLVQFQFDRFYFNWRRREEEYPRYFHVIENFEKVLSDIKKFFQESSLGDLIPVEYELTYINHLEYAREWEKMEDLTKIFNDFLWNTKDEHFLPFPEALSWRADFKIPNDQGELVVNLRKGLRTDDAMPLIVFQLTAKGPRSAINVDKIREWFDLAHEWIVKGFTDLTTPHAHKIWEKE